MEVLLSLEGLQICMEFSLLLFFFFLLMGGGALNRMEWLRKRNPHIAFLQMSVVCVCKIQNCVSHLLLHCEVASRFWSRFLPAANIPWAFPSSFEDLLKQWSQEDLVWSGACCSLVNLLGIESQTIPRQTI